MKQIIRAALLCAVSCTTVATAHAADTKSMKIALSNNYAGNSWRQAMLKSWESVSKKAVADGVVAEAPAFTTSENRGSEQPFHPVFTTPRAAISVTAWK